MEKERELLQLRSELLELCRELGEKINVAQRAMASDKTFVQTERYRQLRSDIRRLSERLQKLKKKRQTMHHCYSVIIEGDVMKDGKVLRDYPLSCELTSVINCELGDSTTLSRSNGSHKALWNLLKVKFGSFFLNQKFRMGYIVQLR